MKDACKVLGDAAPKLSTRPLAVERETNKNTATLIARTHRNRNAIRHIAKCLDQLQPGIYREVSNILNGNPPDYRMEENGNGQHDAE